MAGDAPAAALPDYVAYQVDIAEKHVVPLLRDLGLLGEGPFLDLGCGQGGFSIGLANMSGLPGHGVDLNPEAIRTAREAAGRAGVSVDFSVGDVLTDPLPGARYPLVLLRDVVEHLADIRSALGRIRDLVTDSGALYVTFPPWLGPFAGHQHNAESILRFLPYLHAASPDLFLRLARRWETGREAWLEDEAQIVANRLTMSRFDEIVAATGWSVDLKRTYLIRPALMRMGLRPVGNGWIGGIPLLGELLTTGCEYVLRPEGR